MCLLFLKDAYRNNVKKIMIPVEDIEKIRLMEISIVSSAFFFLLFTTSSVIRKNRHVNDADE